MCFVIVLGFREPVLLETLDQDCVLQRIHNQRGHSKVVLRQRCCSMRQRLSGMSLGLSAQILTCSVPYLQLDFLVADLYTPELKVDSDGREQLLIKLAVHKLAQERGFPCIEASLPTAESPTSTSLYSAATTGIIINYIYLNQITIQYWLACTKMKSQYSPNFLSPILHNRNQMEKQKSQVLVENAQERRACKSSRRMQSEKFVAPTHPAYIITANFQASHIKHLQEQLEKHYIAMCLQTGKKKLMKIPQMPSDRFFIIADDSQGPPLLEGEFLILNARIVNYPVGNNAQQVVTAFDSYIGLGHFEKTDQYYQNNDNTFALGEKTLCPIQQGTAIISSTCQGKSICLKEVSSIRQQTINGGRLYVYQNRNDNGQFKTLVSQLESSFHNCNWITFIQRIDQYNGLARLNRADDHFVLLSHYSFTKLSQYFQQIKGFAVFAGKSQKIDLFAVRNVVLLTSRIEIVLRFIQQFTRQKTQISQRIQADEMKNISGLAKEGGNKDAKSKSAIKLVRVSDLDTIIQRSKKHNEQGKETSRQHLKNSLIPTAEQNFALKPNNIEEFQQKQASQLLGQGYNQLSDIDKKTKIKRLKSSKSTSKIPQFIDSFDRPIQPNIRLMKGNEEVAKKNSFLINSHLRMGSDNNNSRSQQKLQLTHRRMRSDDHEGSPVKICVTYPKPSVSQHSAEPSLASKQRRQQDLTKRKSLVGIESSKNPNIDIPKQSKGKQPLLKSHFKKGKEAQNSEYFIQRQKKSFATCPKKIIRPGAVPPVFDTMSDSISILKPLEQESCSSIDNPGLSNISSILLKQNKNTDDSDKSKRFTFGLKEEVLQSRGQQQKQREKRKSKSLLQVTRVFNRRKEKPSIKPNEIIGQEGSQQVTDDPYQSIVEPNYERNHSNVSPKVGRIYNQFRPRPLTRVISRLEPQISNNEFLQEEIIKKSQSVNLNKKRDSFEQEKQSRDIQDVIDMSKFQKIVENGIVVYRSKIPISAAQYSPTIVQNTVITTDPLKQRKQKEKNKENPYELSFKKKATEKVKYKGAFYQENVGVQCQPESLSGSKEQPCQIVVSPRQYTNITSQLKEKNSLKKKNNPICDLLASKVQSSNGFKPKIIKNIQFPKEANENESLDSQDDNIYQDVTNSSGPQLLYLIEKSQPHRFFEQIKSIKSSKDSLISFKDEKKLAQQLPQTINIYDVVFVIPKEITNSIEKMVQCQPNCYIVRLSECETKIIGKKVIIRKLKQLRSIGRQIEKQQKSARGKVRKAMYPSGPMQEHSSSHHCCHRCPRHS